MSLAPSPTFPAPAPAGPDGSPPARRAARPGWRDPRFALGLVLVALSVVVGVRVVEGRDDTTPVLAAARPLAAGEVLGPDDLQVVEVRFTSGQDADRYLPGTTGSDGAEGAEGAEGAVLTRPVGEGELVPRDATDASGDADVQVPLAVPLGSVPSTVSVGSVVDVWATGEPGTTSESVQDGDVAAQPATRVLRDVPVLSLGRGQGLGPDSEVRVVVGVPERGTDLADVVSTLATSGVVLVHRPAGAGRG